MWKKPQFAKAILAKLDEINRQKQVDANPNATYHNEQEYRQAIDWLKGRETRIDFKVESRQRDGVWRHSLLHGTLGFSAASPLITIVDGEVVDDRR